MIPGRQIWFPKRNDEHLCWYKSPPFPPVPSPSPSPQGVARQVQFAILRCSTYFKWQTITGLGFHKGILPNATDRGMDKTLFEELVRSATWTRNQNDQIVDSIMYEYTDWAQKDNREAILKQFVDLITDAAFKAPAILSAQEFVAHKLDTYFYCFDYRGHSKYFPDWLGVYHTAELRYVFGKPLWLYSPSRENDTEILMSKKVIQLWTNFAKKGYLKRSKYSVCINRQTDRCIYTYVRTYIHTYIHTYKHIPTYIHTGIHTCIHAYIHACMHTYIQTYIHTNIHTFVHTYIHTHTYIVINSTIGNYVNWDLE